VLVQMLGVLVFFVTTRYRMAVVPWLALAAAWAVAELARAVRQRDRRAAAMWGTSALIVVVLIVPDHFHIDASRWSQPDFDLAQVQLRNGLREEALASYRRAAQRWPDDPDVMLWYAEHLERMGHQEEATAAYLKAVDLAPSTYKPALSLGASYILRGDLDQAWRWLQEAERRGDDSGRSLYNMALVRERQGRYEEALQLHRRSLQRDGEYAERARARLGVARCLVRLGRGAAALADLRAAASMSKAADFQLDVAATWIEARRPQEALVILVPRLQSTPTARVQALAARAWAQQRRWNQARRAAAAALAAQPDNARFQTLLEEIERQSGADGTP
jgi:tetratricopeptide (TPR) repeat protein